MPLRKAWRNIARRNAQVGAAPLTEPFAAVPPSSLGSEEGQSSSVYPQLGSINGCSASAALARADLELPAGTALRLDARKIGVYQGWRKRRVGSNDHFLTFGAAEQTVVVKLKSATNNWIVVPPRELAPADAVTAAAVATDYALLADLLQAHADNRSVANIVLVRIYVVLDSDVADREAIAVGIAGPILAAARAGAANAGTVHRVARVVFLLSECGKEQVQTVFGAAALGELLAALKTVGASNEKVAGWICAALTSLVRDHPPNLAALGALGGAAALAEALAAHEKKSEAGRDAAIALAQLQHGGFVERDRVVTAQMRGRLDEMVQVPPPTNPWRRTGSPRIETRRPAGDLSGHQRLRLRQGRARVASGPGGGRCVGRFAAEPSPRPGVIAGRGSRGPPPGACAADRWPHARVHRCSVGARPRRLNSLALSIGTCCGCMDARVVNTHHVISPPPAKSALVHTKHGGPSHKLSTSTSSEWSGAKNRSRRGSCGHATISPRSQFCSSSSRSCTACSLSPPKSRLGGNGSARSKRPGAPKFVI